MDRLKSQNTQPESPADEPSLGSISASQSPPIVDEWILSAQQTKPGDKIGRYEVIHEIGRGGMSIVYKARDHELNRLVALKLMLKSSDESLNLLRFQKEARAASQLEHPNIVKVHDFSTTSDGTPYLVMSYLDGISLADAIKDEGSFSLGRWLSVMIQACDALEHAHLAGIVHRDIKPSNFVLAQEHGTEVLKLVDFGIAANSFDDMSLTKTGEVFGSPLYMSPEQCAGSKLDSRSDIYSLGCVMYEALAGKPPISGTNSLSTLQKHLTDKPVSLTKLHLKVKHIQQVDRIVMRCLEKSPESRYQHLEDLKKELEQLFQGESGDNPNSTAVNVPVLVATALAILVIFITLLNFDKIADRLQLALKLPSTRTETSSNLRSKTSQSAEEKLAEWQKCRKEYTEWTKQGKYQVASVRASKCASLAKAFNLPPYQLARSYVDQGFCEGNLNRPLTAIGYCEQALLLMANATTRKELELKWEALMLCGLVQKDTPNLADKAEANFKQALDLAVQLHENKKQAESLVYIGHCCDDRGDFRECLVNYYQALKLDPSDEARNKKNIKRVEQKLKQNAK